MEMPVQKGALSVATFGAGAGAGACDIQMGFRTGCQTGVSTASSGAGAGAGAGACPVKNQASCAQLGIISLESSDVESSACTVGNHVSSTHQAARKHLGFPAHAGATSMGHNRL